jgi:hypothetical protein
MSRVRAAVLTAAFVVGAIAPGPTAATAPGQEHFDNMFCVQRTPDSACYNGAAQTLTADVRGTVDWVALPMSRADFTTQDLEIELRSGTPDGALLATSNRVVAAEIPVGARFGTPDTWDWIEFTFSDPPSVDVAEAFAIVVPTEPVSDSADPAWGWGKADRDLYAAGGAYGGVGPTHNPPDGRWDAWWDGSDFAFRTPVSQIDAPPIPTLDVTITPAGRSVPQTGTATIGGSFACPAAPLAVELVVTVNQDVGKRTTVHGSTMAWAECTETGTWTATVSPDAGFFKPGFVDVHVEAAFTDAYGQTGDTTVSARIMLRK